MTKMKHKIQKYVERVVMWIGLQSVNSACTPLMYQLLEPPSLEKYKVIK